MAGARDQAARAIREEDFLIARPTYTVWEVTMHCDQPCQHCGSRAGPKRERELSTEEALEVARSLGRLGTREVALIGGEAYLRKDLPAIIGELARQGIRVIMQTGGRNFPPERARLLRDAGLSAVGVSVDGPEAIHDELRGNVGSFAAAMQTLDNARDAGLVITANTQFNRLNFRHIRETYALLREKGIQTWQVQLTVPMGRAADKPEWIIEPWRVIEIVETLAELQAEAIREHKGGVPFNLFANNNIGYFGPHEVILRSNPGGNALHWPGCRAGINTMGIESDGTIKGCPSLPTAPYAGGNVRESSLESIWESSSEVRFARDRTTDELWGFCKTCYYADVCRAGCSWTAHCTLGRRGNNPFCYYRATQLRRKGIRERLVPKERAAGEPYDFGRLELVEEPWVDEATDTSAAEVPVQAKPRGRGRKLPIVG